MKSPETRAFGRGSLGFDVHSAYVLAELSNLAYYRFAGEGADREQQLGTLIKALERLQSDDDTALAEVTAELRKLFTEWRQVLKTALNRFDFQLITTFSDPDTGLQAYLAARKSDKVAVIAFRGTTANLADIFTDADIRFYEVADDTSVHNGFSKALQPDTEEAIRAALEQPDLKDYRLFLTGHSLGGAMALVTGYRFSDRPLQGVEVEAIYTFGSPRVGDLEYGELIDPPIFRVVYRADIVTRLPAATTINLMIAVRMLFETVGNLRLKGLLDIKALLFSALRPTSIYAHYGDMRFIDEGPDGNLRMIENLEIVGRTSYLFRGMTEGFATLFTDHKMEHYVRKLRELIPESPSQTPGD